MAGLCCFHLVAVDPQRVDALGDLPRLDGRQLGDGGQPGVFGQGHGDVVQSVRKAPDSVLDRWGIDGGAAGAGEVQRQQFSSAVRAKKI